MLPEDDLKSALCELFDIDKNCTAAQVLNGLKDKAVKTFFFESKGTGVVSTDISSLDVEADDSLIADWGGIVHWPNMAFG